MEKALTKSNQKQWVPPRRGQIKMKIMKSMVKSAVELASTGGRSERKNGSGGYSTPSMATPGETPSGYDSGADSDR